MLLSTLHFLAAEGRFVGVGGHFNGGFFGQFFLVGGFQSVSGSLLEEFFFNSGLLGQFFLRADVLLGHASVVLVVVLEDLAHDAVGAGGLGHARATGEGALIASGPASGALEVGCARTGDWSTAVGDCLKKLPN